MSAMTVVPLLVFLATANPGPAPGNPTVDPKVVSINSVRIILDRKENYVSVQQSFHCSAGKGNLFSRDKGYALSLPEGAWGPRILGGEERSFEMLEDRVVITEPITSQGLTVTISFNLPIKNSTMVLKQQLGVPVGEVQVYSNWTDGPTNLKGRGFIPAEQRELSNGVLALFVLGRHIEDGNLLITLSGLTEGVQRPRAMWTMGLSIAVLLIGFVLWLRRRGQSTDDGAA